MNNKNENLEQLLRQFVDETQARQMTDDIRYADQLFSQHPAPAAPSETISTVQRNMRHQLEHHKKIHRKIRWASAAAVAAIITMGVFILYSNKEITSQSPFQKIAQSPNLIEKSLFSSDTSMAEIEKEITSLSEVINSINSETDKPVKPVLRNQTELDKKQISDNTEFWKG